MNDIPDLYIYIDCTVCEDGGNIQDDGFDEWHCWDCGTFWTHGGNNGRATDRVIRRFEVTDPGARCPDCAYARNPGDDRRLPWAGCLEHYTITGQPRNAEVTA